MEVNLEKRVKLGCVSAVQGDLINKKLYGQIFTIIDATVSDLQSRKAVKSLVSQAFTSCTRDVLFSLNEMKEEK